jgi:hypothetical protein
MKPHATSIAPTSIVIGITATNQAKPIDRKGYGVVELERLSPKSTIQ